MVWRSVYLQASFNYERMQAGGWLYSILPGLEKSTRTKRPFSFNGAQFRVFQHTPIFGKLCNGDRAFT